MKKTQGPYKSPSEDVKSPEVSSMKLLTLTVFTVKWEDSLTNVNAVRFKKKTIFTKKNWNISDLLSYDVYIELKDALASNSFDFDFWEIFKEIKEEFKGVKIRKDLFGVAFLVTLEELPMHPDIPILAELKQEIKKTLKIYQDEENVIKSLIMSRAVTNLCKYHF